MARPRIGSRSRHPLVSTLMLSAALAGPARAVAQAASPEIPEPLVTVTAGLGNAMGWLGVQGERYLAHGLLSVFGGLGYTPQVDAYDPEGITLAAGVRGCLRLSGRHPERPGGAETVLRAVRTTGIPVRRAGRLHLPGVGRCGLRARCPGAPESGPTPAGTRCGLHLAPRHHARPVEPHLTPPGRSAGDSHLLPDRAAIPDGRQHRMRDVRA
jgi:hypothetical protein